MLEFLCFVLDKSPYFWRSHNRHFGFLERKQIVFLAGSASIILYELDSFSCVFTFDLQNQWMDGSCFHDSSLRTFSTYFNFLATAT